MEVLKVSRFLTAFVILSIAAGVLFFVLITLVMKRYKLKIKYQNIKAKRLNQIRLDVIGELGVDWDLNELTQCLEIPRVDFQLGSHVGSGVVGAVYRGKLMNEIQVATKIPLNKNKEDAFKLLLNEIKMLSFVGIHPNILNLIGANTAEARDCNDCMIYLISEFCAGESLLWYLQRHMSHPPYPAIEVKKTPDYNLKTLCRFSSEIASGMECLCEKRIIHGNLCARSVLLTSDCTCKIAYFSIAQLIKENLSYTKQKWEPLDYRWAPEISKTMECTLFSDVWSYGVTLWEIFSLGATPYINDRFNSNLYETLDGGYRLEKPIHATDNIYDRILSCWNIVPERRPRFLGLKHYFEVLQRDTYYESVYEIIRSGKDN